MLSDYKDFWKSFVYFKGRTSRSQFWLTYLVNSLISLVSFGLVALPLFGNVLLGQSNIFHLAPTYQDMILARLLPILLVFSALAILWQIVILLPNFAIQVRRLRDAGFHWTFILFRLGDIAVLIPYVGWVLTLACRVTLLVFFCLRSKK